MGRHLGLRHDGLRPRQSSGGWRSRGIIQEGAEERVAESRESLGKWMFSEGIRDKKTFAAKREQHLSKRANLAPTHRAGYRAQHCPATPWVFCDRCGRRIASVKKSFAQAARQAALSDIHPHDLRRTCGSWLVQDGVPLSEVAALLRHSDIRVTVEHYAHLAPENVRAAVARLEGTMSRSGHVRHEKSQLEMP